MAVIDDFVLLVSIEVPEHTFTHGQLVARDDEVHVRVRPHGNVQACLAAPRVKAVVPVGANACASVQPHQTHGLERALQAGQQLPNGNAWLQCGQVSPIFGR